MREFTPTESIRPRSYSQGWRLWVAVLGLGIGVAQALRTDGWWQLIGLVAALAALVAIVLDVVIGPTKDVKIDDLGLTLPGKPPRTIAWSQVQEVTSRPGGSREKHHFVMLRDGSKLRTDFPAEDDALREAWRRRTRPGP